jgi:hypothetical protein
VRYEAEGDPMMKAQCRYREIHLRRRAQHVRPDAGLHYTRGAPKQFTCSDLERSVTREFCAECGTHLVTRPAVVIKVGTLDDPALFGGPQMATYAVDKQAFHTIPEGMPSFDRLPQRRA